MKTRISIAATLAAVMAVGSLGMNSVFAAPPHATPPAVQNDAPIIQVASKKKHRRVHRGDPAAAAAVLGLFGAIAGMAAQDAYRDRYYYDDGYYYGGPGPVYNYAPRYQRRYYSRPGRVQSRPGYIQTPDGQYHPPGPNPYGDNSPGNR